MDPIAALYWLLPFAAFGVVFAIYCYLLAKRMREIAADDPSDADEAAVDRESGTVTCPDCDAENELGYTYCRRCVGELPGEPSRPATGNAPSRRGIF